MSDFVTDLLGKHVEIYERAWDGGRFQPWRGLGVGVIRAAGFAAGKLTVTLEVVTVKFDGPDGYAAGDLVTLCPDDFDRPVKLTVVPTLGGPGAASDGKAFKPYRRSQTAELRPWHPDDGMTAISVSAPDRAAGSPKVGDMIARNPKNHADQWLVAAQYFADNFEAISDP
ncbi:MAG: hypothetical protein IPJ61_19280 [Tessaracoccus sp.]|uniref:hypothetical protein n=1 Tax=Tessaracoccus sp. TaxID=1971211 RepID=UPI001EB83E55|nr:hypothetical protein [Tessaracoccus sp.]MBK7823131.1 hypothetical protein [Tessaracoccus sp.]